MSDGLSGNNPTLTRNAQIGNWTTHDERDSGIISNSMNSER
jgi:hypothetical protein